LLPQIKKDENSGKTIGISSEENSNVRKLKNILMPKNTNKARAKLNNDNYSNIIINTENSIIHEDDSNISRILKTTVDERDSHKMEMSI